MAPHDRLRGQAAPERNEDATRFPKWPSAALLTGWAYASAYTERICQAALTWCEEPRPRSGSIEMGFPAHRFRLAASALQGFGAVAAIERDGRAAISERVPRCRAGSSRNKARRAVQATGGIPHTWHMAHRRSCGYLRARAPPHMFRRFEGRCSDVLAAQLPATPDVRRGVRGFRCGAARATAPDGEGRTGRSGGTARPVPVVAARPQAARATGMPSFTAFSTRLSVMPEPGKAMRPLGSRFRSSSLRRNGAARPWRFQSGLHTT